MLTLSMCAIGLIRVLGLFVTMLVSTYLVVYVEIRYHRVLITFLFKKLILRQNRGNHTSTVSDTPIQTKRYAKPLRCLALKTRNGRILWSDTD